MVMREPRKLQNHMGPSDSEKLLGGQVCKSVDLFETAEGFLDAFECFWHLFTVFTYLVGSWVSCFTEKLGPTAWTKDVHPTWTPNRALPVLDER